MMEHSPTAFDAGRFMEIISRVRNAELLYTALSFFVEEEPALLLKLLHTLMPKLDHTRVVHQFKKIPDAFPVLLPYLKAAQKDDLVAVNEAVNQLLVEEEDVEGLRASIDAHPNFDQVGLAQRLEKHELLELRRIAALLYKKNKRWEASIALSKQDSQFKDAIDTASASKEQGLAEALLNFFVQKGDKECFTATLFTCYSLIRPDVAMELAWRARLTDSVMPFMIQYMRDTSKRIASLEAKLAPKEEEHAAAAGGGMPAPGMGGMGMMMIANEAYVPTLGGMGGVPGVPGFGGAVPGFPGGVPGFGAPPPFMGGGMPPPPPSY